MSIPKKFHPLVFLVAAVCVAALLTTTMALPSASLLADTIGPQADNPNPPANPVKLVFIHHSCGDAWLDAGDGNLGNQLGANNYYVSDTYYDWGPDDIGSYTDIGNWWDWFQGSSSTTYTQAVYDTTNRHADYTRPMADPGGENQIVMFKSCYPNSHLGGNPSDPPPTGANPLRGEDYTSVHHTVGNAKGIYNDILEYFRTRRDKLFVVITAPPLVENETDSTHAANARAFNNWLVNDWLDGYPYNNVAVFDFYNILTSNGGNPNINDVGSETGNHHRWWNSIVQHVQTVSNNFSAYGSDGDSHPTAAGNQKATAEFVQLLNIYYNRWGSGTGPTSGKVYLPLVMRGYCICGLDNYEPNDSLAQAYGPLTSGQTYSSYISCCDMVSQRDYFFIDICTTDPINIDLTNIPAGVDYDLYLYNPAQVEVGRSQANDNAPEHISYNPPSPGRYYILVFSPYSHYSTSPYSLRVTYSSSPPGGGSLIQPADLVYQGAFRLPAGGVEPETFAYGGNAMTFNPNGDPSGPDDGFPGSLFVTGHDRMPYGELPDGSQVAEISIPVPVNSDNLGDLNQAGFLQGFHNVAQGFFTGLDEIPRIGMEYLDTPATGPKIHLAWGQHFEPEPTVATHAWSDPNLSAPDMQGTWFIGNQSFYSVNGYMFEIPASWADAHAAGRYLATGRYRDGGWSGMGPALFAYRPWIDDNGTPASSGTHLAETVLLLYESSENTENIERCLNSYQHPDEWEGGAWITTNTGNSAVLFAGTKGTGAKYWYGWANPAGPQYPCVEEALVGQFTLCRLADGTPCPSGDLTECAGHNDYRGWWSARFDAQFILYDPADLAQVAAGATESWAPQPYDSLDIDDYLFLNPTGVEPDMLGTGIQRRNRIGAVAFDRNNQLLYVLELFADEAQPVVHVWRVEG